MLSKYSKIIIKKVSSNLKNLFDLYIYKLLLITTLISLFLFLNTPPISFFFRDPDQGAQLAKAMEILNGIHPFINIKGNIYGPLVFYMSALGQFFSGNKLIGEVIIILLGYFIAYFSIFYLIEKISKRFYVSFILLMIALTLLPRFYKYYIALGPALFLLAVYYYIHDDNDSKSVLFLSLSIGLNILFRFDFGIYSFVVFILTLIIVNRGKRTGELILQFSKTVLIVSGVILPWVIFVIVKSGSFSKFFELFSIIKGIGRGLSLPIPVFNLTESLLSQYNNFSLLFWLFRLLPFFVLIILYLLRKEIEDKEKFFIFITSVYCMLIFMQVLHRTSMSHLFQAIPISFILLGWMSSILITNMQGKTKVLKIPIFMILIFFVIGWGVFIDNNKIIKRYNIKLKKGGSDYKFFTYSKSELRKRFNKNKNIQVVNLINEFTEQNEPVLFIPIESQLYYFSERLFQTSMGVLGPGRLKNKQDEIDFFNEISESGTKIIIDRPFFTYDRIKERNPRYYYPALMNLIYSHYRIVGRSGDTIILCNDDRFEKRLMESKYKFRLVDANANKSTLSDVEISIDSINTFPVDKSMLKISHDSFIFSKGTLKIDLNKFSKNYLFFGLMNNSEVYISKFRFVKKLSKNSYKIDLFSSLNSANTGSYELVIAYGNDKNLAIKNTNIFVSVL